MSDRNTYAAVPFLLWILAFFMLWLFPQQALVLAVLCVAWMMDCCD